MNATLCGEVRQTHVDLGDKSAGFWVYWRAEGTLTVSPNSLVLGKLLLVRASLASANPVASVVSLQVLQERLFFVDQIMPGHFV